jgi:ribosomal protein L11 methyltransferase
MKKHWLTVDLLIPRRVGEAVSNFLMEQGAPGIEEREEDSETQRLRTYFLQNGSEKKALSSLQRYLNALKKHSSQSFHYQIETVSIPEQDWGERWKRFFKPVLVTPRTWVKPPWAPVRLSKDQIVVEINPGVAFGTGTHATTQLCIKALEKTLRKEALSVLDVGTGSGILSIVAAKWGAREVCGIDRDGASVENARENVMRNQVSDRVLIRRATVGSIRKMFDLVVANIDLKGLKRMRWPLVRRIKKGGHLILSGVLEREKERIRQYYRETRLFRSVRTTRDGEWICLVLKRK